MSRRPRRLRPRPPVAAAERLERRALLTAYVVDTPDDGPRTDGRGSLREAVLAAATDSVANDAAAGEGGGRTDTISFSDSLADGTITLLDGALRFDVHTQFVLPPRRGGFA